MTSATQSQPDATVLLISCYELGHLPAGLSVPLGFLRDAGIPAEAMDVSVEGFDADKVRGAQFVGVSVPMHTALRLGVRVAREVRRINPSCHVCFYGLYAVLNAEYLRGSVADSILGGELEGELVELVRTVVAGRPTVAAEPPPRGSRALPILERLSFSRGERGLLPSLERYAQLEILGERRLTGYVEASRGCLYHCTHCPIPPVYGGRFFVVPRDVVIDDVESLIALGARHITFGDPDFLNGPTHSLRIVRELNARFPDLTFDFTTKIEHVLKYRDLFPEFAESGCVFVVSAVESLSDFVLERLAKGHSRVDVGAALAILRSAGIAIRPSLTSFTPWTTLEDYVDVLDWVEDEGLIDHIDPVQYSIRLLIPPGSLVLHAPDSNEWLGPLVQESLSYEWSHRDGRMEGLHRQVSELVEQAAGAAEDPGTTFYRIRDLARSFLGGSPVSHSRSLPALRHRPPRLTEAWFC